MITVIAGVGSSGKSLIAHGMAAQLIQQGKKVVVVEGEFKVTPAEIAMARRGNPNLLICWQGSVENVWFDYDRLVTIGPPAPKKAGSE